MTIVLPLNIICLLAEEDNMSALFLCKFDSNFLFSFMGLFVLIIELFRFKFKSIFSKKLLL